MTTPDIAGLCERLRNGAVAIDIDCTPAQVGPYPNELREAADALERQAAEIEKLRGALAACVNAVAYTEGHDGRRSYSLRLTFGKAFEKARAALTGEDTASV
jgi:hypothetical protein